MRKLNNLLPAFLKKMDRHLLENHPIVWNSKIHFVAFFFAVISVPMLLKVLLFSPNLASVPDLEFTFGILMVPTVLVGMGWMVYQLRFNAHKQFGANTLATLGGKFALSVLSLGMIAAPPLIYSNLMNYRVANMIPDEELIHDIEVLNEGDFYFNDYLNAEGKEKDFYYRGRFTPYGWTSKFESAPSFVFEKNREKKSMRSAQQIAELEAFYELLQKYGGEPKTEAGMVAERFSHGQGESNMYRSHDARKNIQWIVKSKVGEEMSFNEADFMGGAGLLLLYAVFTLMIFKNVTWIYFLAGGVVSVLLPTVTALIGLAGREMHYLVFGSYMDQMDFIFPIVGLGAGFLIYQSFSILSRKSRSWVSGISLVTLSVMTPLAPILFTVCFKYYGVGNWTDSQILWPSLYAGCGLFVMAFMLVYRKMFERLYALPG